MLDKKTRTIERRTNDFLCPYCLQYGVTPTLVEENQRRYFACNGCNARIPSEYLESASVRKEIVATVGLRGHGKSTFLASALHALNEMTRFWPGYYTFAVDEKSLDSVREHMRILKAGELPQATTVSFPTPIIIKIANIPFWRSRILLFYDVGGDAFARASSIVRHAGYVKRARTVLFFLNPDELDSDYSHIHDLLSIYIQGLTELGGSTRQQSLLVLLSKGDRLKKNLAHYPEVWDYLTSGTLDRLSTPDLLASIGQMRRTSSMLAGLLAEQGATHFLNLAYDRFRSVEFCIISALGCQPGMENLQVEASPKRILDPLLWTLHNSYSDVDETAAKEAKHEWTQIFHRRPSGRRSGNVNSPQQSARSIIPPQRFIEPGA